MYHIKDLESKFDDFLKKRKSQLNHLNKYKSRKARADIICDEIRDFLRLHYTDYKISSYSWYKNTYNNKKVDSAYGVGISDSDTTLFKIDFSGSRDYIYLHHTFLREDVEYVLKKLDKKYDKVKPLYKYTGKFVSEDEIKGLIEDVKKEKEAEKERKKKQAEAKKKREEAEAKAEVERKKQEEENKKKKAEAKAKRKREQYLESIQEKELQLEYIIVTCMALVITMTFAGMMSLITLVGASIGWAAALGLFSVWWSKDDERRLKLREKEFEKEVIKSRDELLAEHGIGNRSEYDELLELFKKHNIDIDIEDKPKQVEAEENVRQ